MAFYNVLSEQTFNASLPISDMCDSPLIAILFSCDVFILFDARDGSDGRFLFLLQAFLYCRSKASALKLDFSKSDDWACLVCFLQEFGIFQGVVCCISLA